MAKILTSQPRLVRDFISSTLRGMPAKQDRLVKFTFPELRRRCRARQVEFVDVDLHWGGERTRVRNQKSGEKAELRCMSFPHVLSSRFGHPYRPMDSGLKINLKAIEAGDRREFIGNDAV